MNNGEKMNGGEGKNSGEAGKWDFGNEANWDSLKMSEEPQFEMLDDSEAENEEKREIDISVYQKMFAERDAERREQARERLGERRQRLAQKAEEKLAFKEQLKKIAKKAVTTTLLAATIAGTATGVVKIANNINTQRYETALAEAAEKRTAAEEDGDLGEKIDIESVTFHGAPHIREIPVVTSPEDGVNDYGRLGEEDESITVDLDTAYLKEKDDVDGDWYGFEAEKLAEELLEEDYISEWTARNMAEDEDGVVWVNRKYCSVKKAVDSNETSNVETGKEATDSEGIENLFGN